jgi:beta-ribofuranosylaminobenzene 5'-phosphate synthase
MEKKQMPRNEIEYSVPSRIAISLYDMNGDMGRIDGGMGFSLEYPRLIFRMSQANKQSIDQTKISNEMYSAITEAFDGMKKDYKLGDVNLSFLETIPEHSGFGSKTATLLSTSHAYCSLFGVNVGFEELRKRLKRGGTSGLGINLIDKGGFILEGGHSINEKKEFLPSSQYRGVSHAPILARFSMPDWPILLILPHENGVCGKKEVNFFKEICPVPSDDVDRIARITLSKVLPAIAESNLEEFCNGINLIQESVWKKSEIGLFGEHVKKIRDYALAHGALGAGMSSIGPCVYCFGNKLEGMVGSSDLERIGKMRFVKLTKADNKGYSSRRIE